ILSINIRNYLPKKYLHIYINYGIIIKLKYAKCHAKFKGGTFTMNYDIKAIMKYWEYMELEGVPPNMVYRIEKDNKIINQFIIACLTMILAIALMVYIVFLCITSSLNYLICIIFPFASLIILVMHLEDFLYLLFNQNYKIVIKEDQLHFYNVFGGINTWDLPIPITCQGENIILGDPKDCDSPILSVDTVNEDGKQLIDFLLEVNGFV
ncbi:MAG: hypothetical protein K2H53_06580, partial [Clostridia bacterium]|nr:hypothetical protein [Clostridia bacterium]